MATTEELIQMAYKKRREARYKVIEAMKELEKHSAFLGYLQERHKREKEVQRKAA